MSTDQPPPDTLLPEALVIAARRVIAENRAAGRMVCLAESCTGGLVSTALTEVPGSSAVLDRAFVTYSNEAKQQMLGVSPDIIDTFGAVSIATAWAMAQGAILRSNADVAVAITGVAGPDGGSDSKPIGTVVFAKALRGVEEIETQQLCFDASGRADVRLQAALTALELLLP